MRRALFVPLVLLALAGAAGVAGAQTKQNTPPPSPGRDPALNPVAQEQRILSQVYLGEPAPDFELDSSTGRPVRLAHLKGYWVLLVFSDSRTGLAAMREREPELRRLGVKPFGLCADKAHVIRNYAQKEQLPFTLLADVTGEISQLYGLYDTRASLIRPGFVLIDRQGRVCMAMLGHQLPWEDMLSLVQSSVTGS